MRKWSFLFLFILLGCKPLPSAEKECLIALDDAGIKRICNEFRASTNYELKVALQACMDEQEKNVKFIENLIKSKSDFSDLVSVRPNTNGPACRETKKVVEQNRLRKACYAFMDSQIKFCHILNRLDDQ